MTVSHIAARDEWYKWSPTRRISKEGPISGTKVSRSARKRHFRSKLLPAVSCAMPACDPCSTDRPPDWMRYSCSNKQSGNQGFKIGQEAPHFRSKLLPAVSCAMPACDPCSTDRTPDWMRYSCSNKQSGNQGFKIGQEAPPPALIVSAKRASGRCDVEVVVVRLQGRPRQLPDRMRYSCFDNRSGGNQDIKIGRTSYGPRNTICGGSSKVGCAIGFQGVANGSTSARPHTLI